MRRPLTGELNNLTSPSNPPYISSHPPRCYSPPAFISCYLMDHQVNHSVLKALKVVCNVSREDLQPHRAEALLAFQQLYALIGEDGCALVLPGCDNSSPPLTDDHRSSSPSLNCHDTFSIPSDTNESSSPTSPSFTGGYEVFLSTSKPILRLIQSLNNGSTEIKQHLSISEREVTEDKTE